MLQHQTRTVLVTTHSSVRPLHTRSSAACVADRCRTRTVRRESEGRGGGHRGDATHVARQAGGRRPSRRTGRVAAPARSQTSRSRRSRPRRAVAPGRRPVNVRRPYNTIFCRRRHLAAAATAAAVWSRLRLSLNSAK